MAEFEIGGGNAVEEGVIIPLRPLRSLSIGEKVTLGHGLLSTQGRIGDLACDRNGSSVKPGRQGWGKGTPNPSLEGAVVRMNQKVPPRVVVAATRRRIIRDVALEDEERMDKGKQLYLTVALDRPPGILPKARKAGFD